MSALTGVATDTPDAVMTGMVERWRQMSPSEKLDQVAQLNHACEQLSEAGVRSRHPDADDNEVRLRVFALRLGRELMVNVYDWDPAIEGW
ncbi:MAG: hypothetical protein IZT58_03690 [Actinobacteria bacterium]|nr:hypothetical protein [Actinomycetota bacterium]